MKMMLTGVFSMLSVLTIFITQAESAPSTLKQHRKYWLEQLLRKLNEAKDNVHFSLVNLSVNIVECI